MRKKGSMWTIENLVSIVVAVLVIATLVFAGYKFYEISYGAKNQNANTVLDSIVGKIDVLQDGESNTFLISGVEDWYLVSWSKDTEGRPDKCFFKSCLCVCPGNELITDTNLANPLSKMCQERGVCRNLDQDVITNSSVSPPFHRREFLFYAGQPAPFKCIKMPANLIDLKINKTRDKILISHDYGSLSEKDEGDITASLALECLRNVG